MPTDISSVPFIEQFFGIWLFEESQFWAQYDLLRKCDLHFHLQSNAKSEAQAAAKAPAPVVGKIAVISINGKMMKQQTSMGGGTSTVAARRQVRSAMNDPDISGVALHVDSPGGTAAGTQDLADDVAALAKRKPVLAYIEDFGASAAFWVASQSTHISVNRSGMVGSIGTYGVVYDTSGMAAMEGVKAHVVRAGQFKGVGTPGTEISQEQLAELQRNVDALNAHFIDAVAIGRRMTKDKIASIADGRVHVGDEALSLGLVDSVESFDAAFARLQSMTISKKGGQRMLADHIIPESTVSTVKENSMSEIVTPVVATSKQIKAACPGCNADFILAQLEANATMEQVKDEWITQLTSSRIEAETKAKEESEKAEKLTQELAASKAKPGKHGVEPVGAGAGAGASAGGDDAVSCWNELVSSEIKSGKSLPQATRACVVNHPEAHAAYVQAHNSSL